MAKVVGIMGLAGAGKDTVAQMLQRGLIGAGLPNVSIGKFATTIYKIAEQVFSKKSLYESRELKEIEHVIEGGEFENKLMAGIDSALYMQMSGHQRATLFAYMMDACEVHGKDWQSSFGPYYSISPRQFLQKLGTEAGRRMHDDLWVDVARQRWDAAKGLVLVTDVRFENEVQACDKLIFVKRPGAGAVNAHVSEKLARDIDLGSVSVPGIEFIDNDGTLEDLEVEVATMACSYSLLFAEAK